ncbi:hypothetical protein CBR_g9041 [Chara braunii]|uniref:Tf2-1-like SH3-like domain-containing protein n=1 Tax=Chara braunii TaxID=69332 RepID=A0A388KNL4_CHABU|nr:hypothetical protein CBR_g9041 [Chara braunii]|eukprot:GBG71625.1 hypothetical protein CBR_g9041 [Chara braunii]
MTGLPGQLANEPIADYKKRFHAQLALIEAEEQRQLAAKAAQLQAEEAATAEKLRLQAEAVADAQARRKEAQALRQRHEANSIEKLKYWQFEPNGDEATPEEQHKEFMAKLVSSCWGFQQCISSRQLEERVDHVVEMLGDISTFVAPTTISSQLHTLKTEVQQLQSTNTDDNPKMYKMPTFQLDKFDDYTQQDPVLSWEAFTTQLRILPVAKHAYIGALFLNSKGGCQTWLSHLASSHGVDVPDLKDKITWEELTRLWKKRFIVDDTPALAINRLFTMSQGNTPTRDWLTGLAHGVAEDCGGAQSGIGIHASTPELLTQARANMQKAQVRMQQQANRRRVPCLIRAGDLVWVSAEEFALEQDVSRKLLPKWFGPWSVTAATGDEPDGPSFVINIPEHLTVHPVFHASKLATYTPAKSDDFPGRRSQDPPSMDGHQEVDRIISDRKYGSKPRQYKVTFKACDRDDTRWISSADSKASAPLIYAHYEKRRLAQEASRPAPPTRTVVPPSDIQLRPRR